MQFGDADDLEQYEEQGDSDERDLQQQFAPPVDNALEHPVSWEGQEQNAIEKNCHQVWHLEFVSFP